MKLMILFLGVVMLSGCGSDSSSGGSCGAKVCIKGKAEVQ